MDREIARIYVHRESAGDQARCKQIIQSIKGRFENLYKEEQILGYRFHLVESEIDAEDLLVWCEYKKITKGRFPFVCSWIQPTENNTIDFDDLMATLHFARCQPT
jgi:hypothetical protein